MLSFFVPKNKKESCTNSGDLNPGDDLPMAVAEIEALQCMWGPLTMMCEEAALDPTVYSALEEPYMTQFVWGRPTLPGRFQREYRFRVLKNLGHKYPSGANYPVDYVPLFYSWMNQFTR